MGYCTDYDLSFDCDSLAVEEMARIHLDEYVFKEMFKYGDLCFNGKWCNHEDEMIALSEELPDAVFELFGYGEEKFDIWKKTFRNGEVKRFKYKGEYEEVENCYRNA